MRLSEEAVALFGADFVRAIELDLDREAHAHYARVAMKAEGEAGRVIRALLKEVEGYQAENDYLTNMLREQARGRA